MKVEYKIEGMSCNHCVMALKKSLSKLNLKNLEVKIGCAIIEFDETNVSDANIIDLIEEAGYQVVTKNILSY